MSGKAAVSRALIVGDETSISRARLVPVSEYDVELVSSLAEAVTRLTSGRYDRVMLDPFVLSDAAIEVIPPPSAPTSIPPQSHSEAESDSTVSADTSSPHRNEPEHARELEEANTPPRESEAHLRQALGAAFAGAWEWDLCTGAMTWSPENYELYGLDPSKVEPSLTDWARNVQVDDLHCVNQAVRDAMHGVTKEYRAEFRVLHPERGLRWVLGVGSVEFGDDGTAIRMSGINIDITERKHAEEELREADALLQAIMEGAPDPVYVKDREGRILMCNAALARVVGKPTEEILGRTDGEYYGDPDVGELLRQHDLRVMASGEAETTEETVPTRDGYRTFLPTKAPYRDASGDVIGITGISRDITERKRAEEALRDSEERYRAFFDNVAVGTAQLDLGGRFVEVNDRFCRMTGYSREELLGMTLGDLTHPDDRTHSDAELDQYMQGKIPLYEVQKRYLRKDGSVIWMQISAALIRDADGKPARSAGVIQDITARKRAEEELASAKELLERQVCLLQRALIPTKPGSIQGYSVASAYIPAFTGEEVGGDFIDVFTTEDHKVGILIGDVTGKGIESAAMAATTRATVRAFAYDSSCAGDALTHANSVIAAHQVDYMQFVTSFLAILDPATGDLSYSSAGHPPAMISRESGTTELLCAPNMPLGVVSDTKYVDDRYTLRPGDRLILYTDGVTEARRGRELFEVTGAERVLAAHGQATPDELVARILDAVNDWAQGNLRDDTAVLIVGRDM